MSSQKGRNSPSGDSTKPSGNQSFTLPLGRSKTATRKSAAVPARRKSQVSTYNRGGKSFRFREVDGDDDSGSQAPETPGFERDKAARLDPKGTPGEEGTPDGGYATPSADIEEITRGRSLKALGVDVKPESLYREPIRSAGLKRTREQAQEEDDQMASTRFRRTLGDPVSLARSVPSEGRLVGTRQVVIRDAVPQGVPQLSKWSNRGGGDSALTKHWQLLKPNLLRPVSHEAQETVGGGGNNEDEVFHYTGADGHGEQTAVRIRRLDVPAGSKAQQFEMGPSSVRQVGIEEEDLLRDQKDDFEPEMTDRVPHYKHRRDTPYPSPSSAQSDDMDQGWNLPSDFRYQQFNLSSDIRDQEWNVPSEWMDASDVRYSPRQQNRRGGHTGIPRFSAPRRGGGGTRVRVNPESQEPKSSTFDGFLRQMKGFFGYSGAQEMQDPSEDMEPYYDEHGRPFYYNVTLVVERKYL